jgi:hypothetical protein
MLAEEILAHLTANPGISSHHIVMAFPDGRPNEISSALRGLRAEGWVTMNTVFRYYVAGTEPVAPAPPAPPPKITLPAPEVDSSGAPRESTTAPPASRHEPSGFIRPLSMARLMGRK